MTQAEATALETRSPREIVAELDRHIVGQAEAKRAVAVALRNRWRRRQLDPDLQREVVPRNILMIGPTGVGKTEIARRVARLAGAPFLKVEASKFTEVGYVGRDVESIVRDLADESLRLVRDREMARVADRARRSAEARIVGLLEPGVPAGTPEAVAILERLQRGEYESRTLEVEAEDRGGGPLDWMAGAPGMAEMERSLKDMLGAMMPRRRKRLRLRPLEALQVLTDEAAAALIDDEDLKRRALELAENDGIVFLDEIDKVARRQDRGGGPDVSGEGVQRDLLPIVEGSTVQTRIGPVRTEHVLFIAAGAFHVARPSDLIPELQGRFPIRVELQALGEAELVRILTEPEVSLLRQAEALLATEGVQVGFDEGAVAAIARAAAAANRELENIGARRLQTILERVLEEVSFAAPELAGQTIPVTADYVRQRLQELDGDEKLRRFIL